MTDVLDTVVVGGGVIGVAVARVLAMRGHDVVLLEAERALGQHQSSRNSEVIHAGLYYPTGSLRATLCVQGRQRLYAYCETRSIGCRRVGKLVVATRPHHDETLAQIAARARDNGVEDVTLVDAATVRALEPAIEVRGALRSPSTGVVDSHGLLSKLWGEAADHGAQVALATRVAAIDRGDEGFVVRTHDDRVACRHVVLAAGFSTQAIARTVEGMPPAAVPPLHLAKGSYFSMRGRPFVGLVYPVPDTASLGIHVTLDLQLSVRFGPDQQWVDDIDYAVDTQRREHFTVAVREYFPALNADALRPDYAGIRSKVQGPGEPPADFVVAGPGTHGIGRLVALYGIESPGLTACLPLADLVADRLTDA